jgi:hypothetical protein
MAQQRQRFEADYRDLEARSQHKIACLENDMTQQRQRLVTRARRLEHEMVRQQRQQRLDAGAQATIARLEQDLARQQQQLRESAEAQAKEAQVAGALRAAAAAQQARLDEAERQLRQVQQQTFAGMARARFTDEEDSSIMRDVRFLHQNVWTWAKDHCLPALDGVRMMAAAAGGDAHNNNVNNNNNSNNAALMRRLVEAGVDPSLLDASPSVTLKKLPALVLAAVVAEDIYQTMFDNPFFFVDSICADTPFNKQEALGETFDLLFRRKLPPCNYFRLLDQYQFVTKGKAFLPFRFGIVVYLMRSQSSGDPNEAVHWRAQLLRTLYPWRDVSATNTAADVVHATESGIANTCDGLAQLLVSGVGGRVLGPGAPLSSQKLQRCYVQAGKLFTRLHAQTLELRCFHAQLLGMPYNPHWMQPHPLHGSIDDGNDSRLAGKKVVLVVSPLLEKLTRREGQIFGTVLVKAVVCLDI